LEGVGKAAGCHHIHRSYSGGALDGRGGAPRLIETDLMSNLNDEIGCRRTFAIISHPDAGKTTLTAVAMLNAIDNDRPKIARFVSHIQRW
jgi:hypothetical protein